MVPSLRSTKSTIRSVAVFTRMRHVSLYPLGSSGNTTSSGAKRSDRAPSASRITICFASSAERAGGTNQFQQRRSRHYNGARAIASRVSRVEPRRVGGNAMRLLVNRTIAALALAGVIGAGFAWVSAQQARGGAAVAIDPDDIGGVVTGPRGPEAGVWVVAETTDLPTRFTRIVITDDQGRYVVPDLPKANYDVFVRGYGLVDSPRVKAAPGRQLNLTAVSAPDGRAAAQIYPPSYWLGLMEIPKGELSEQNLLGQVKECVVCHQLGDKATREIPKSLGTFASSADAWDRRVDVGPSGTAMAGAFLRMGAQRKMFADWTDKIAAGAFPRQAPPRPAGLERNIVVTLWDWAVETGGRSDGAGSDERNPSLNANGPVYGVIQSDDLLTWVDPATNKAESIRIPSPA